MTTIDLSTARNGADYVSITARHFGVNVVTVYDQEFAAPDHPAADLVKQLGASTLRFPGGSATELYFDMTQPEATSSLVDGVPALTPMTPFMQAAGRVGAEVSLVIPTRLAFAQTAAEAMFTGDYGARSNIAAGYLADVTRFVQTAFAAADAAGTRIVTLELGNEFWGSGQMTATEYGRVVARLAPHLEAVLASGNQNDVKIVAQATSAASKVFSPRDGVVVYVAADGTISDSPLDGSTPVAVEAQGRATAQIFAITQEINAAPGAADALDGVVLHLYQRGGLTEVDGDRAFSFTQMAAFEAQLQRTPDAPDLERHITEWNVAARDAPDNAGLKQAAMIAEAFFEMTTNRVTDAQIWPLSFNAAQGTALTDQDDARLSIAGEMFRLMQESLPGLRPALDWSVTGQLDVHGYTAQDRAALFVSERSGAAQSDMHLDASGLLPGPRYFVTMSELWDGGRGGSNAGAAPVIRETDGRVLAPDALDVSLQAWANLRIELSEVGWRDDVVTGRGGHDRIFSYGGADSVDGGAGHDVIKGGKGNDQIIGGAGNDWLYGETGSDQLRGGDGRDTFVFRSGDGLDEIADFDLGTDRVRLEGANFTNLAELDAVDGISVRQSGDDVRIDHGDGDVVTLRDVILPLQLTGSGRIVGGKGDDTLTGSFLRDDLRGKQGDDVLRDGGDRDILRGGDGADRFVLDRDGAQDRITDFTPGLDVIDLQFWDVAGFSALSFEVDVNADGRWMGRSYLRWTDETLRLDGLDAVDLAGLSASDFLF